MGSCFIITVNNQEMDSCEAEKIWLMCVYERESEWERQGIRHREYAR